jgi:hypothetical protein
MWEGLKCGKLSQEIRSGELREGMRENDCSQQRIFEGVDSVDL